MSDGEGWMEMMKLSTASFARDKPIRKKVHGPPSLKYNRTMNAGYFSFHLHAFIAFIDEHMIG